MSSIDTTYGEPAPGEAIGRDRLGAVLQERSLVPGNAVHLAEIRFQDWQAQPAKA